jgi:hypothetical protein
VIRPLIVISIVVAMLSGARSTALHAAAADLCAPALERYVLAPDSRTVAPVAIERVDGSGVVQPDGLLVPGGQPAVVERASGSDPAVVVDFGRVVSGRLTVATVASNGPELRLAVSESLVWLSRDSDVTFGDQHTHAWRAPVSSGELVTGQVTLRYAVLFLGTDGRVEIDHLRLDHTPILGTPDTYAGCFESSDDELNRIWYSGAYTLELNTVDTGARVRILDGAKRDRDVWVGDLALAARVEYVTHNRPDGVRDSLAELADRQRADGTIPPSSYDDYGLVMYDYYAWWVVAFAEYGLYTGDTTFSEAYYPHMLRQLDWFTGHVGPNGLVVKDTGIEWAFTLGRNGEVTYINAVYYRALVRAAALADWLGHGDDAARWRARADALRAAINARLFDPTRGVYVDSDLDRNHVPQDANALAVLFDIAPVEWRPGILTYLRDYMWTPYGSTTVDAPYGHNLIHDKRIWPFAGYFELDARFAGGDASGAFDLLRREWGHMLRFDPASTMWEWMTAEGAIENGFASLAHGWSAGPTVALTERVLGLRLTEPGFRRFDALPVTGDLDWAQGRVPTPHGPIDAFWRRTDDAFVETLDVPAGTTARAGVPNLGDGTSVHVDGELVWDRGQSFARGATTADGYIVFDLGPGRHFIDATTDSVAFPETGQALRGVFKDFWERSGGLPVFGYPLAEQRPEGAFDAQYFERQRFEYHPEYAGTSYEVLLGRLGAVEAARRGLLDDTAFQPRPPPATPNDNCVYFPETGHYACHGFLAYWRAHGLELGDEGISNRESLALFGYPISEELVDPDTGLVTQYFERARFEFHPANPEPWRVLLGRVGAAQLEDAAAGIVTQR